MKYIISLIIILASFNVAKAQMLPYEIPRSKILFDKKIDGQDVATIAYGSFSQVLKDSVYIIRRVAQEDTIYAVLYTKLTKDKLLKHVRALDFYTSRQALIYDFRRFSPEQIIEYCREMDSEIEYEVTNGMLISATVKSNAIYYLFRSDYLRYIPRFKF